MDTDALARFARLLISCCIHPLLLPLTANNGYDALNKMAMAIVKCLGAFRISIHPELAVLKVPSALINAF